MRHNYPAVLLTASLLFATVSGCSTDHYEPELRAQFQLPPSATFTVIEDAFGDGFKEKLKYQAEFSFSDPAFQVYKAQIEQNSAWQRLPMTKAELTKLSKSSRIYEYILHHYYPETQSSGPEPPNFNAKEEQYFKQRIQYLNLDVREGAYRCLTAGTDLMYAPKVSCKQRHGRLNDLMLGILDYQTQTLKIRAYTGY